MNRETTSVFYGNSSTPGVARARYKNGWCNVRAKGKRAGIDKTDEKKITYDFA